MGYYSSIVVRAKALVIISAAGLVFGLVGCNSGDREVASQPGQDQTPAAAQGTNAGPMTGGDAMMGGQAPADLKPLKQAQADYDKSKKAFDASPKDDKAKKAYEDATMSLADAYMFGDDVDRKTKYKDALQYYREVVKLDPSNKQAQANADLIVSIYKQMGRPVPGGG